MFVGFASITIGMLDFICPRFLPAPHSCFRPVHREGDNLLVYRTVKSTRVLPLP